MGSSALLPPHTRDIITNVTKERKRNMRIVGFDEFCSMPAGTIFAPYTPCVLEEELAVKTDTGHEMPADYHYYRHGFNGVMPLRPWLGDDCNLYSIGDQEDASFEIYDGCNADYMEYKTFLVFEDKDIERLINVLVWAKNGCVGECDCGCFDRD